jgi:hypothetical protein
MKLVRMLTVCAFLAAVPQAWAQKWELGGAVGGGFYTSQDVTSPGGSAEAKIQSNLSGSAWFGNNGPGNWGGEVRYDYQSGDLQLSSGGTQATFAANTQAVHYDFLYHFSKPDSRIRPFVAAGAGIKIYRGTGTQVVYQPLSNIALLSQDQDLTALISVGGGVKVKLAPHLHLRLDVHDYLTTFPKQVITPAANAKVSGWLQDIVPMAGLGFLF